MPEQDTPVIDGKYLLDLTTVYLGGYANAFEPKDLFAFINEGKDAVWAIMKTLRRQYFVRDSQSADSAEDNYFGVLSTTAREYTLPVDCREVLSMEVLTSGVVPSGIQILLMLAERRLLRLFLSAAPSTTTIS